MATPTDETGRKDSAKAADSDAPHDDCTDENAERSAQRARALKRHSKALGGAKLSAEYQRLLDDLEEDNKGPNGDDDGDDGDNDFDDEGDDGGNAEGEGRSQKATRFAVRGGQQILVRQRGEEQIAEEVADEELEGLEAFNLEQERSDGYFDRDGNYVRFEMERRAVGYDEYGRIRTKRKGERRIGIGASAEDLERLSDGDGDDVEDAWMDELEGKIAKEEAKKKKRRGRAMDEDDADTQDASKRPMQANETKDEPKVPLKAHLQAIAEILQENETVLKALKRLKPPPSTRPRRKAGEPKALPSETESAADSPTAQVSHFAKLTEAADSALYAGKHNIYELNREAILKLVESENPSKGRKKWLYKWSGDASQIFGPFSFDEMKGWWDQGHFTPETGLLVKEDGTMKNYAVLLDISQLNE